MLHTVVTDYKYRPLPSRWGVILGWILAGYLEEQESRFGSFDTIIPSPTYVGEGAKRSWDHIAFVLAAAHEVLDPGWPVDASSAAIRKLQDTPSMVDAGSWQQRHEAARDLATALRVDDPGLIRGRRILVFDDVFTDGHTLFEVARALKRAGAKEVCGVTLGRQPWTK